MRFFTADFPFRPRLVALVALVALLLLPLLAACGDAPEEEQADPEDTVEEEAVHGEAARWGYESEIGPGQWATLDPAFAACEEGVEQSPINITEDATVEAESLRALGLDYEAAEADLDTSGYVVHVEVEASEALTFQGQTYNLAQFHFHAPSEHALGGTEYPAEVHFVHQSEEGSFAVIGAMIEEGEENAAFAEILAMPEEGATVNPARLLPQDRDYYTYRGSLTTPPCTEDVRWITLQEPIAMSAEQIRRLNRRGVAESDRPVQPLGEREVLTFESR